jgi:hypothetical protein
LPAVAESIAGGDGTVAAATAVKGADAVNASWVATIGFEPTDSVSPTEIFAWNSPVGSTVAFAASDPVVK